MGKHGKDYADASVMFNRVAIVDGRPMKIHCLSATTVEIILSISEWLYFSSRWSKDATEYQDFTEEEQAQIRTWTAKLERELMIECVPFMLRQSITYPCQLEQSWDGGESWWPAFDYSLCPGDLVIPIQQIKNQNRMILNALLNLYDGTIPSIHEDAPTDYYDGDGGATRTEALCLAIMTYVYSYAQDWCTQCEIYLTGGLAVLFIFAVPVLGWIALVVMAGIAYFTATALDAMKDEEALNDVVCCMFNGLQGVAVTREGFENSLSDCSFGGGTNSEIARSIIESDLSAKENWLSFVHTLGEAYNAAEAGVEACICEDTWCHEWLLGNGEPPVTYVWGTYNEGEDRIDGECRTITGDWDYWETWVLLDMPTTQTITRVLLGIAWDGSGNYPGNAEAGSIAKSSPLPTYSIARHIVAAESSGTYTLDSGEISMPTDQLLLRATAYCANGCPEGYARITYIKVCGLGTDPFLP